MSSTLLSDVRLAAENLALHLPTAVLAKAAEYVRLAHTRNVSKTLGKHIGHLHYFCIQLACETLSYPFSAVQSLTLLKLPLGPYSTALASTRSSLQLPPPAITFETLGVRLGATQMVASAKDLMAAFRENYGAELSIVQAKSFVWDGPDVVASVFFVCCNTMSKLAKREVAVFAHNVTQFNKLVKTVEAHCKDEIAQLKAQNRPLPATPSGTRKRKAADIEDADAEPNEDDKDDGTKEIAEKQVDPPETPKGRRKSPRQVAAALRTPQTPAQTPSRRPRMGASAARGTPLSRRRRTVPTPTISAESTSTGSGPPNDLTPEAAPLLPGNMELNYAGVNIMISQTDILHSKKHKDFLAWRERVLASLPAEIVAKYTPSSTGIR